MTFITEDNMRLRVKQTQLIDASFFYLQVFERDDSDLARRQTAQDIRHYGTSRAASVKTALARLADQYANRQKRQRRVFAVRERIFNRETHEIR